MRLALVLFTLSAVGCGNVMYRYDQTTASTALAAMACRDALSEAVDKKVAACAEKLKTEGTKAAQACLDTWHAQYDKINTGCMALKLGAQSALASREVIEAAASKNKDALGWIARLAKLAVDVIAAFSEAGLKFGGVK